MNRTERLYEGLLERYGPQHWWPARSGFEVIVGALLMQQTAWKNVATSIENLKSAGLLDPGRLANASVATIRSHVGIAGLYRTKPARLKAFCRHLIERSGGNLRRYFDRPTPVVRADLLAQPGVGPETADSILLYAGSHPIFVVDAYTIRIGRRIGLFETDDYKEVQGYFTKRLPPDVDVYKEFHALLVAHAKSVCRPTPRCEVCAVRTQCAFGRDAGARLSRSRANGVTIPSAQSPNARTIK